MMLACTVMTLRDFRIGLDAQFSAGVVAAAGSYQDHCVRGDTLTADSSWKCEIVG